MITARSVGDKSSNRCGVAAKRLTRSSSASALKSIGSSRRSTSASLSGYGHPSSLGQESSVIQESEPVTKSVSPSLGKWSTDSAIGDPAGDEVGLEVEVVTEP